jgi:3-oxoacyl-[acyl-carrier-protein] synthase-3
MAFLHAFGSYLPARIVGNKEIGQLTGADPAWISNISGIEERRFAAPGETVAALAFRAAEDCLTQSNMPAASLGMILVASGTSERSFPGPAAAVAHRLGLSGPPAIDLPMPSAGALFALALAARLAPAYGNILVVAAERMSDIVLRQPIDPNNAVLFGDGAGACLVTSGQGAAQIVDSAIYSDGAFTEDLQLPFDGPLHMNGRAVIMQASRKIPRAIADLLARHSLAPADVVVFLMHQANQNLINGVARALSVPPERFFSNIRRYGNTSAASMLIAAAEWSRTGSFSGQPVIFAGFGAGFHWGALLVR